MKNVLFSLSPATIELLESEKRRSGRSKSEIVRQAVHQYCAPTVSPRDAAYEEWRWVSAEVAPEFEPWYAAQQALGLRP